MSTRWRRENLTPTIHDVLGKVIHTLRSRGIDVDAFIPLCMPGEPGQVDLAPFFSSSCGNCFLYNSEACLGLSEEIPSSTGGSRETSLIPYEQISLDTFLSNKIVAHWMPRKWEIQMLAETTAHACRAGGGSVMPILIDVGCGSGFLTYLFASTGLVKVVGIDRRAPVTPDWVTSASNQLLVVGDYHDIANLVRPINPALLICWPPTGSDFMKKILELDPVVIFVVRDVLGLCGVQEGVLTVEILEKEGGPRYHLETATSLDPGEGYHRTVSWPSPSIYDLRRRSKDPGYNEINSMVEVFLSDRVDKEIRIDDRTLPINDRYPWEDGLDEYYPNLMIS